MEVFSLDQINKNLRIVGEMYFHNEDNILMFGCFHCKTSTSMSFFKSLSEICQHNLIHLMSEQSECWKPKNNDSENQQSTQILYNEMEMRDGTVMASSRFRDVEEKESQITNIDENFEQNVTVEKRHINARSSLNCTKEGNITMDCFIDLTEDDDPPYQDSDSLIKDVRTAECTYDQKSFCRNNTFQKRFFKEIQVISPKEYFHLESNFSSSTVSDTNRIASDFPVAECGRTQTDLCYRGAQNVEYHPQLDGSQTLSNNNNDDNNNNDYKKDNKNHIFEEVERKLEEMHYPDEESIAKYNYKGFQNKNSLEEYQEEKCINHKNLSYPGNEFLCSSNSLQSIEPSAVRRKIVPMVVIPHSRWANDVDMSGFIDKEVYRSLK